MNNVVDYETIEDIALEMSGQGDNNSSIPGVSSPQIDASTGVYNMPEGKPTTPDLVGWTTSIVWSATDYRVVAWTAGDIKLADGTTYSVDSGNTGNMSAVTYIYYNGTTTLQKTTTPQDAVGEGKIMLCVAKNITDTTGRAIFQPFGTVGGTVFITAANIAANTITANEIASNTITATQMNVSQLSAISANLGTITAGTITGATIRTTSSGARIQLDKSYLRGYDANYERIRIQNDRIVFWDSDGNETGQIVSGSFLGSPLLALDKPLSISGVLLCRGVRSTSDNTYDIGLSSYQRRDLYLSRDIYINGYVLDESDGHLRWRGYGVPYTIAVASATHTPNTLIRVRIDGKDYNLSARAI